MRTATATWLLRLNPGSARGIPSTRLQFGIGLQEIEHVGHGAFAIAAIVIEEFDKIDIAVLVASTTPRGELKIVSALLATLASCLAASAAAWRLLNSFIASSSTSGWAIR